MHYLAFASLKKNSRLAYLHQTYVVHKYFHQRWTVKGRNGVGASDLYYNSLPKPKAVALTPMVKMGLSPGNLISTTIKASKICRIFASPTALEGKTTLEIIVIGVQCDKFP